MRTYSIAFLLPFLLLLSARPAFARTFSIPVAGQWSTLRIGLTIPQTPTWARALILNAANTWNLAQLWFQQHYFPGGMVFTFAASRFGNVTVSYGMPTEVACIAVGWTEYVLDGASTITAAHVYLDGSVFNDPQEPNATGLEYGFRVALHELGRVLGLGSLVDGSDIMDPIGTISRATVPPTISFIDLFALHVLASRSPLTSPTIILSTDENVFLSAWNLLGVSSNTPIRAGADNSTVTCPVRLVNATLHC